MANKPHPFTVAFWTYVIPMSATRGMRLGLLFFGLAVAAVLLLFLGGFLSTSLVSASLRGLRHFIVMVGVPVGAVLLGEIPIRDGITHRTLLYPLLGPVNRATHAVIRLLTTAAVLALGSAVLLLIIRVILRDGFDFLGREVLAVTLGSLAYVSLFGLIHLISRRGLIAGLVVLFLFDMPLGTVPFSIRNLSTSYHVGVIGGQQDTMTLPISFGVPDSSVFLSSLLLIALTLLFAALTVVGFRRKNLGDLC